MRALVTGSAGFIGSTLAERLVNDGWDVSGVDCFTPYYSVDLKRRNISELLSSERFQLHELDLATCDVETLLDGVDVIFHQAGQPGVRLSWAEGFPAYVEMNVSVTQRLLEAARAVPLTRFVYASSSSIYGDAATVPTSEDQPTRPFSPYGVTKLAGELLCSAYAANFGVPVTSLRYFTVYGPRQRPDMATHRLIRCALDQQPFKLFGDGSQVRDFTFVDDVVQANVLAATSDLPPGTVCNVAGGSSVTLRELVQLVEEAVGHPVPIEWNPAQAGDVRHTGGAIDRARDLLGWSPTVGVTEGVRRQAAHVRASSSDPVV